MELFDMISNIRNVEKEKCIEESIDNVKNQLSNLTDERTCKIYSSYIYNELKNRHIQSRIVNTLDLTEGYEHLFVIAANNVDNDEYYLIDLTFNQFNENSDYFIKLKQDGYQLINSKLFNLYLNKVSFTESFSNIKLDDVFFNNEKHFKY